MSHHEAGPPSSSVDSLQSTHIMPRGLSSGRSPAARALTATSSRPLPRTSLRLRGGSCMRSTAGSNPSGSGGSTGCCRGSQVGPERTLH